MIRIFYALKIPQNIKDFIIKKRDEISHVHEGKKWEAENKLHVTLKFVGDVDEKKLPSIFNDLDKIEKKFFSYQCNLTKFDFFYRNGDPSILWIGLNVEPSLDGLVNELNTIFSSYGSKIEKRNFRPHITLLRLKKNPGNNFVKSFKDYILPENKFFANQTALIKSELLPAGSVYTELKNYNLKNKEEL